MINNEMIIKAFRSKGLRVTPQRLDVYRFLLLNPTHPSADEIYSVLKAENSSFSRTTIYNSLNALVESGLAITVKIGENELRYDGNADYHGHFKCDCCGKIYDFTPKRVEFEGLDGFEVMQEDVYFGGICRNCRTSN